MEFPKAFVAGFASTLVFHKGLLTLLHLSGAFPRAPYDMTAVGPLGIPAVVSQACWAGVWAMALWPLLRHAAGTAYWLRAFLLGAIAPSAVGLFIIAPLKGAPIAAGWDPKLIVGTLILNGTWGAGMALLMRWMQPQGALADRAIALRA
jgi:hypothetical protein